MDVDQNASLGCFLILACKSLFFIGSLVQIGLVATLTHTDSAKLSSHTDQDGLSPASFLLYTAVLFISSSDFKNSSA